MGRLRDKFPPRLSDPLYGVKSHVARRNGMVDPSKERRRARATERAPFAGGADTAGLVCRVVQNTGSASSGTGTSVTATCGSGETAMGGGGTMSGASDSRRMIASQPASDLTAWTTSFYNTTGSNQTITADAVCCRTD